MGELMELQAKQPNRQTSDPDARPIVNIGGRPRRIDRLLQETISQRQQIINDPNVDAVTREKAMAKQGEDVRFLIERADRLRQQQSAAEVAALQKEVKELTQQLEQQKASLKSSGQLRQEWDAALERARAAEKQVNDLTKSLASLPVLHAFMRFSFAVAQDPKATAFAFSEQNKGFPAPEIYMAAGFTEKEADVLRYGWNNYGSLTKDELVEWYEQATAANPSKFFVRMLANSKFKPFDIDDEIRRRRQHAEMQGWLPPSQRK